MYMAVIHGWTEVIVFSEDKAKAMKKAVKLKKQRCIDDLEKWTWDTVSDFYGARIEEVKDGDIYIEWDKKDWK